jgi:hypothetical protein
VLLYAVINVLRDAQGKKKGRKEISHTRKEGTMKGIALYTICASQVIGLWEVTWEGKSRGRGPLVDIYIYRHNRKEQSNKWGDEAHLRIIAPLPSGANVAKTKSATGNIYGLLTSKTFGVTAF